MDVDLQKEAPNVVTEPEFRQLLRMGCQAQLLCEEDAFYKAAVWYGGWTVRVVSADGTLDKLLATYPRSRGEDQHIKIKVFKTINACASFMHRMGFAYSAVPFYVGEKTVHFLPGHARDTSNI